MWHLNVHDAIGATGAPTVEVVARPNESEQVARLGMDPAHPRNHAEVAKQARRRVGR